MILKNWSNTQDEPSLWEYLEDQDPNLQDIA